MAKLTMKQKFAKKIKEDAINWLEQNGFKYPYSQARNLNGLPKYVSSYFKHNKENINDDELEPNA